MNNYQNLGANQTPQIGNTQLIACPVCRGSSTTGTAYAGIFGPSYQCSCCNGEKQVRMTANGALFPLSAFSAQ